jgi:hypothetical protein
VRHPATIVLSAMLEGQRIQIGEMTYVMGDSHDLCWVGRTDSGEERYVVVLGADLPSFIKLCESMNEAEVARVSANSALTAIVLMAVRDKTASRWSGWSEAFAIFAKYSPKDAGIDHVSAEHDELYAGPSPGSVSPDDLSRLEALGWHQNKRCDCFSRFT